MQKFYFKHLFSLKRNYAQSFVLSLCMILLGGYSYAQLDVTLGSGTGTSNYLPIYYYYGYNYTQTIYTVGEFNAAGATGSQTITKIRYKPSSSVSTSDWEDWVVYLGNTAEVGFDNDNDWIPASNLTEVFNGTFPVTTTTADQWIEITLAVPFVWDGSSNLVVAIDENTSGYGGDPNWYGYSETPTSGNKGIYYYSDGTNPDPASPPSANSTTNNVAQIQFEMTPTVACSGQPSAGTIDGPLTFGACPNASFNISTSGVTVGTGITYQWQGRAAGSSDAWQNAGTSSNLSYPSGAFTSDLEFRLVVSCTNSGLSDTSSIVTVTVNPYTDCYCVPSTSYTGDYLSALSTTGALTNLSYTATAQPTGSYADETAQTVSTFETQTIDFLSEYVGGNYTINGWVDWDLTGSFDPAELIFSSNGASPQTVSLSVPVGTPVGNYRVRVRAMYDYFGGTPVPPCGNVNYGTTVDFMLEIQTPPTCMPVNNIGADSVVADAIRVYWSSPGTATSWNVEWGTPGFTPGTSTSLGSAVATDTFQLITGLTASTDYDIYVQSDCGGGDTGYWMLLEAGTDCAVKQAFGYCENFDVPIEQINADCWMVTDGNGDGENWAIYSANGVDDSKCMGIYRLSGTSDDYIFLPRIELTGNEVMTFSYRGMSSSYMEELEVLLSFDSRNTADFNDTILQPFTFNNDEFKDTSIDLSAYTGNVFIAFHVPASASGGYYTFVDDICIDICTPNPGIDGSIDICRTEDTVDLNTVITSDYTHGDWYFSPAQGTIDGSIFDISMLAEGAYNVEYVLSTACTSDTTIATVNIVNPPNAGIGGTMGVCKNEPINLYEGLTGEEFDVGGDWYDYNDQLLSSSQPTASSIPGSYNYKYVIGNDVCPADSTTIEVIVADTCDYLALTTEEFNQLSVYPNPATSQINISNPANTSNLKLQLMDINGRIVLEEDKVLHNASSAVLQIDQLERGIYTLRIFNETGQKVFKVVKQ